jgi:hemerythrin-like domain-containing protein
MDSGTLGSRRRFLCLTGGLAAGIALAAVPSTVLPAEHKGIEGKEVAVNPVEDLMREHGILRRVLLIYEEAISRINGGRELPPEVVADSAAIIRRFLEDYHEKLEEDELFPRFKQAAKFDDLIRVLSVQHEAGRRLTDSILKLSKPEAVRTANKKEEMPDAMRQLYGGTPIFRKNGTNLKYDMSLAMQQFIHMYRPHAAMEDTVLFPAFHSIVPPGEFEELGEKFEEKEQELFGKEGFEKMADSVGEIEKKLGIHDLSRFTPTV